MLACPPQGWPHDACARAKSAFGWLGDTVLTPVGSFLDAGRQALADPSSIKDNDLLRAATVPLNWIGSWALPLADAINNGADTLTGGGRRDGRWVSPRIAQLAAQQGKNAADSLAFLANDSETRGNVDQANRQLATMGSTVVANVQKLGSVLKEAVWDPLTSSGCHTPLPSGAKAWGICPGRPGHPAGWPLFGPKQPPAPLPPEWRCGGPAACPTSEKTPTTPTASSPVSAPGTASSVSAGGQDLWRGLGEKVNNFVRDPIGTLRTLLPH